MNIIEMLMHFVWFASGFVPGALIAQRSGIFPGLILGFIVFLIFLFTASRVRVAFHRKRGTSSKRP